MKILIFGLNNSGKSTISEPLAKLIDGVWLNADQIREKYNDWDFSEEGRIRQASRMKYLADGIILAGKPVVADFVCPTNKTREEFDPDIMVWMDTVDKGPFEDTNQIFEKPDGYYIHIFERFENPNTVLSKIMNYYYKFTKKY